MIKQINMNLLQSRCNHNHIGFEQLNIFTGDDMNSILTHRGLQKMDPIFFVNYMHLFYFKMSIFITTWKISIL